jgi:hypothetical protein
VYSNVELRPWDPSYLRETLVMTQHNAEMRI